MLSYIYPKTIEIFKSKYNGIIRVNKFRGGLEIIAGGYQQSGRLVEEIWNKALKTPACKHNPYTNATRILILGFGAGSVAKPLIRQIPNSNITAIEIDPAMIKIYDKYIKPSLAHNKNLRLKIYTANAKNFVAKTNKKYSLIIVDLYQGGYPPPFVWEKEFIKNIKNLLSKNGMAMFNVMKDKKNKKLLQKAQGVLENVFNNTTWTDVLINRVFICK